MAEVTKQVSQAFPERLYKYGSMNKPERLQQILLEDKLHLSNPFDFNDPFDCWPRLIIGQSKAARRGAEIWLLEQLKQDLPERGDTSALRSRFEMKVRDITSGNADLTEEHGYLPGRRGVCCFTADCTSILMWSHYADGAKGYCLEFSTEAAPRTFTRAYPIKYRTRRPTVEAFPLDPDLETWGKKVYLTKARDWKYEREWRVLSEEKGFEEFPSEALTGIILGCNMKPEHEERIASWLGKRTIPTVLKKAKMNHAEYRMDVVDV